MLAAALIVYINCVGHGFVWDDEYLVVDNPQIKDWRRAVSLFVSDLFPPVQASGYYRPLQALTNLADYHVWGLLPAGFHLTNILLHAAAALMFYVVGAVLLRNPPAALLAALLFAVHPVHTEAIAYIAGRSDPLAAVFLLAALLGFAYYRRGTGTRWLITSLACFALALLAREASLALILLLPLVDANERRLRDEPASAMRTARYVVPYLTVVIAYVLVRRAVINAPALIGPPADTPVGLRALTMMNAFAQYCALLLMPVNLHMERAITVATSFVYPTGLVGLALLLSLIAVAVYTRRAAWPATLGIGWFLIMLVPVANIWPLATFMAEHWLYVPSMGVFLLVGWGLERLWPMRQQRTALAVTLAVCAVLGAATITRNRDWRGPIPLFEATTRSAPHSARAWTNLANAYREAGRADAARLAYDRARQAIAAAPPPRITRSARQAAHEMALLANIEQQNGRFTEAEARYRAALALDQSLPSAWNNLGLTLNALGRPQDAADAFAAAIRLYPDFAAAHSNLGNVRFRRGELEQAKADYQSALRLNPEYAEAYNNLGSVSFRLGDPVAAAAAYRQALRLKPDLAEVRRNLAVVEAAANDARGERLR